MHNFFPLLVLSSALVFGQATNTVTITASRNLDLRPDEVLLNLVVIAPVDQGLDTIVKALTSAGVTHTNLTYVQKLVTNAQTTLQWTFQLWTPVAKLKEATAALTSLQQSIAQSGGLSLSFSIGTTRVSARQKQNCDFTGLAADARNKAQDIAGAAGFGTGTVVGVTGSITESMPECSLTISFGLRGQSAQLGPNSLVVTASRTVNPLPDQTRIGITVYSGLTIALDDITGALAANGVSGAQFSGLFYDRSYIRTGNPPVDPQPLQWSFDLVSPFDKLKDTLAQLDIAGKNLASRDPALTLTYSVEGVQTSPRAQPVCLHADLLLDAKAHAQKIATAAGVTMGPILIMSDRPQASSPAVPTLAVRLSTLPFLFAPAQTCTLSVQFQLL